LEPESRWPLEVVVVAMGSRVVFVGEGGAEVLMPILKEKKKSPREA